MEVSLETGFPKGEVTLYSDASVIMALISLKKANLKLFIRSTSLICISCDQKHTNTRQCSEKIKLLCSSRSDTVFTLFFKDSIYLNLDVIKNCFDYDIILLFSVSITD